VLFQITKRCGQTHLNSREAPTSSLRYPERRNGRADPSKTGVQDDATMK